MKLFRILAFLLLSGSAFAACSGSSPTRTAASCSTTDVQACVTAASDGDTINVPAGTCNYTSAVTITNKSLTIKGANPNCTGTPPSSCTDSTILQDSSGANGAVFIVTNNAPKFVTIENLTCNPCGDTSGSFEMLGTGTGNFDVTFRITQVHFVTVASRAIIPVGTYGLIDHNLFDAPSGGLQDISITGSPSGNDQGFTPWTKPYTPGSFNAVYVEDNNFNHGTGVGDDAIDCYNGARYVFRHNTVTNEHIGCHGTDSGGRSAILEEIYSNTFTNNSTGAYDMFTSRGGTQLVWHNTYVTGSGGHGYQNVALKLYRACPGTSYGAWGTCDGTKWGLLTLNHSSSNATVASTSGPAFFCSQNRDIQCIADADCASNGAGTCSAFMDQTSGTAGYACRDQPGIGPNGQISAPVYLWNNTGGSGAAADNTGLACGVGISNYIAANRDFYNYNGSFTGASGTGEGILASRPATCTTGVLYFATDQGSQGIAYVCGPTNTWTQYYVPGTYPDPLQGSAPSTSFSPTSLAFGNVTTNQTSPPQTVTLTNSGNAALIVTSIAFQTGTQYANTGTGTCGATPTLAQSASCTVIVTCTPTTNGLKSDNLQFTDNASGSPQSVPLSCTGVVATPLVSLSPGTLAFGNQAVGVGSQPLVETLSNPGGGTLTISSITITGTNASDFSKTTTCGGTLAAAGTCTVSVTFTPGGAGSRTGTLVFTTNAASSPDNASLTGTGVTGGAKTCHVNNGTPLGVDTPGDCSGTNPGSITHPFLTMNYAQTQIVGGDTMYVHGNGVYTDSIDWFGPSGSSGGHTLISAYPGDAPIIQGAGIAHGRVKVENTSYMDWTGFTITLWNQCFFIEGSDHMILTNIVCHDIGVEAFHAHLSETLPATPSSFITFQSCTVYNTGQLGADGEGFYIGSGSSDPLDNTNNVSILASTAHDVASEGIELKPGTHDNIVDGNTVYRSNTADNGFGGAAIEIDEAVAGNQHWNSNPNHIVRNNFLYSNGTGDATVNTNSGIRMGTGSTAYNNVIYLIQGTAGDCIVMDNNASDAYARKAYNNTCDPSSSSKAIVDPTGLGDIQNNIGPPSAGNNLAVSSAYFAGYAAHNYRLVTGAAPVGAGANLTATVTTDVTGLTRTVPMDIGAYKYTGTVNNTPSSSFFAALDISFGTEVEQ